METFKLVVMYALEIIVVGVVGATVLAGMYQLVRERARAMGRKASQRRVAVAAQVPKGM
jgi:hypothetical protein